MIWTKKWARRFSLGLLARSSPEKLLRLGEKRVLQAFRRAATTIPAYQEILADHGVNADEVRSIDDFVTRCPVLNKSNTFARFPLDRLCHPAALDNLAGVLTSSGHGARFGYGLTTRAQARHASDGIDLGLEYTFGVDSRKTLLINTLPMGVRFTSNSVTVAETSVREDMAVALATEFGKFFDQIIFVGDPLFLKLVTDYCNERNIDWQQHKVHLIIGEETFGEHFRDYLARHFVLDNNDPSSGMIGSSMGVAELGLNLFYETEQTIWLRRHAHAMPAFFEGLFKLSPTESPLPMLFVYNPLRTYVETAGQDRAGYGELTVSMNDPDAALPLLRYQTGDVARKLSPAEISDACRKCGIAPPGKTVLPIIALKGRAKDELPDGTHASQYKDALFADPAIADMVTGAFRLVFEDGGLLIHIQLRRGFEADQGHRERLARLFPGTVTAEQIQFWPYLKFPYGMTLDYERKFNYYAPV